MPATIEAPSRPRETRTAEPSFSIEEGINRALESFRSEGATMTNNVDEVKNAFRTHNTVILEAQTGAGKSTVAPLLILEEVRRRNPSGKVLVTQPRRDAAEGVASELRKRMGGGDYVGHRFRDENKTTPKTQLIYTMERSLINTIAEDSSLSEFDAIVLDEIHERSLDLDTCMILLKNVQKARERQGRPLKIVLTSATMDPEQLKAYFPGSTHIEIPGRNYKVEKRFAEHPIERREIPAKAAEKVSQILDGDEDGDILMFMPGKYEIDKAAREVKRRHPGLQVITLMGGGKSNIRKLKERADKRTVIIASDVAETSITDDKIRHVIEPGIKRIPIFDPDTKMKRLVTIKSPRSSIDQRIGRAGRVQDGFGHLMITEDEYNARERYLAPQMQRSDLTEQILLLKSLGYDDVYSLDYLDHPGKETIDHAIETLVRLGAIDTNGKIIPGIGKEMTEMATNPYFARMLVEAQRRNCLNEVSIIVGILGREKSVFDYDPRDNVRFDEKYSQYFKGSTGNDLLVLINIWNDFIGQKNAAGEDNESSLQNWAIGNGVNYTQLVEAAKDRREILKNYDGELLDNEISPENLQNILLSIISGLPNNVARRTPEGYKTAIGNAPVAVVKSSSLFEKSPNYFVSGKLFHKEHRDKVDAEYNMEMTEAEIMALFPWAGATSNAETSNQSTEAISPQNDTTQNAEVSDGSGGSGGSGNGGGAAEGTNNGTNNGGEVPVVLPGEESMTHNPDPDTDEEMSQSHYSTEPEHDDHVIHGKKPKPIENYSKLVEQLAHEPTLGDFTAEGIKKGMGALKKILIDPIIHPILTIERIKNFFKKLGRKKGNSEDHNTHH